MQRARGDSIQLLYALAVLAATGVALLAVGLGGGRAAGELSERDAIAARGAAITPEVARRVAELRELEFEAVPAPEVIGSDDLSGLIEADFRRRLGDPEEALAPDEAIARIVGLLGAGQTLGGFVEASGDLAAAAWETRTGTLYLIDDAVATPALLELFLAHELTHAIEDQSFGLPEPDPDDADRALAETALVEGTATALMTEYADRHLSAFALAASALDLDPGTDGFPRYAVEQLEWAYLGGSRFVERLYELGDGWTLVDHALEHRPPASTSQVLHPIKYLRDERPLAVETDSEVLRAAGWEPEHEGTVGELATAQLLALGVPRRVAADGAEGWRGDRYELWERGTAAADCRHPCRDELVLVLRWRWDSPAEAREFARAARSYLQRGIGGERAGRGLWSLDGGWAALATRSDATGLAFAPSPSLALGAAAGG